MINTYEPIGIGAFKNNCVHCGHNKDNHYGSSMICPAHHKRPDAFDVEDAQAGVPLDAPRGKTLAEVLGNKTDEELGKIVFDSVKDSGARQSFGTGSVRDTRDGKGRFDLIPPIFLRRLAKHYENGAKKYGDDNWKKGQPLSRYLDSAFRHLVCVMENKRDEDHQAAVAWNIVGYMWTSEQIELGNLPVELDDLKHTTRSYAGPKRSTQTTKEQR